MKLILGLKFFYRHDKNPWSTANIYPVIATEQNNIHKGMCLAWVDKKTLDSILVDRRLSSNSWELYKVPGRLL